MEKEKIGSKIIKKAFKASVPVMTGYIVLGMGFGILLETKGYGVLWAFLMSLLIYAGSMQYVAVDLISGGASFAAMALTTLMVNARHLFYGLSMVEKYKNTGKAKPYLIFALTDETYSLVCSEDENEKGKKKYFFLVSLFNHCYWITGSVAGSLLGSVITFNTKGIDFALTALFVTVFVEQWKSTKDHLPAITGVLVSTICLLIFGAESFLIPTMVLITFALAALKKLRREADEK